MSRKSPHVRRSYLHRACKDAPSAEENTALVQQVKSGNNPALNEANEREATRLARKLLDRSRENEVPSVSAADTPQA